VTTASLYPSRHVRDERWPQRSDDPDVEPLTAWAEGTRIPGTGLDADEVRYHERTETVLLRRNNTLVTVLDATTANPAVRNAIYHFGRGQA